MFRALILLSAVVLIAAVPRTAEPESAAPPSKTAARSVHLYEPAPVSPWLGDVQDALSGWTAKRTEVADLQPWISAMTDVCSSRQECVELAAIPFMETGFIQWAVDQSCNDAEWRRAHGKDKVCDVGWAIGPFQIHDQMLRGASPEKQATEALEILRRRPQAWTTWTKAHQLAMRWLSTH